jgi:hypothetical protein
MWLMNGTQLLQSGGVAFLATNWVVVGQSDFNGDGRADLLWRESTTGVTTIWLMDGFQPLNMNATYVSQVPTNWSVVGTGDFNGDGMSDILWSDQAGDYVIWEMNGTQILNPNNPFVVYQDRRL